MTTNQVYLVFFSLIVGLFQVIPDVYLTKRTLIYKKGGQKGVFILKTPVEISAVWIFTVYILGMLYEYLTVFSMFRGVAFIFFGTLLFFFAEVVVGNFFPTIWRRENCKQKYNVAYYAILAEYETVIVLLFIFSILETNDISLLFLFFLSLMAASVIAVLFTINCALAYRKAKGDF